MTTMVDPENSKDGARRPEDMPIEGTVFTPRQVGMLKVAVVVMGVLLLAGVAALIVGIMYQSSKMAGKAPPAAHTAPAAAAPDPIAMEPAREGQTRTLAIPSESNVVSISLDGDRMALHVRSRVSAEIVVVDLRSGNVISRLKIADSPGPPAE